MSARLRGLLALALVLTSASVACAAPSGEEEEDATEAGSAIGEEDVHATWAAVVRASGATLNPDGLVTVLGVRGRSLDGARHDATSRKAYDDTFVVLLPSGEAFELPGSTHPFRATGVSGVPDVDGDRRADVGRIRPGEYLAVGRGERRLLAGLPAYDVVTYAGRDGRLPGVRDTNQDGVFDEAEDAASRARKDGLTAVLFHHGDEGSPAAVGCQVLPKDAMTRLARAVGGAGAKFHYVLVDAPLH